jgi:hypothetical protein
MDYSAANVSLWNGIIQLGYIAAAILLCNRLRNRVEFIRRAMLKLMANSMKRSGRKLR